MSTQYHSRRVRPKVIESSFPSQKTFWLAFYLSFFLAAIALFGAFPFITLEERWAVRPTLPRTICKVVESGEHFVRAAASKHQLPETKSPRYPLKFLPQRHFQVFPSHFLLRAKHQAGKE